MQSFLHVRGVNVLVSPAKGQFAVKVGQKTVQLMVKGGDVTVLYRDGIIGEGRVWSVPKTSERSPDIRGSVDTCGKIFSLTGWLKSHTDGSQYYSIILETPIAFKAPPMLPSQQAEKAEKVA
jgi:hypothetical protein